MCKPEVPLFTWTNGESGMDANANRKYRRQGTFLGLHVVRPLNPTGIATRRAKVSQLVSTVETDLVRKSAPQAPSVFDVCVSSARSFLLA